MDNNIKNISWNNAKECEGYYYNGNIDTPRYITQAFQTLATNDINGMERSIVTLEYKNYTCDLDIFWEEEIDNKKFNLVIELFLSYENETINCSEELLIPDIFIEDYLENKMYQFVIESI